MFLHGNNGLSRIKGDGTGRILVIKDSYANCFAPYLTANYADIDVVDFRNYNYGLGQAHRGQRLRPAPRALQFRQLQERPLPLPGLAWRA